MKKTLLAVLLVVGALLTACAGGAESSTGAIPEESEESLSFDQSTEVSADVNSSVWGDVTSEYTDSSDDNGELTEGDFVYSIVNDVARLDKYIGEDSELVLPAELAGHTLSAIGENAFAACEKLKKLTLSDSVVNISDGAFSTCTALEILNLGSGVASFKPMDLAALASLAEVNVLGTNANFSSEKGILYNGDKTVLLFCPRALKADKLTIPSKVTEIAANAFAECSLVKQVSLPEGCLLNKMAFFHCTALESVAFSGGITTIPEKCFFGCVQLKDVTVPEGVTEIGKHAFFGCVALRTASLPSTLTAIGDDVFKCCSALKQINVRGEYAYNWYLEIGKDFINY